MKEALSGLWRNTKNKNEGLTHRVEHYHSDKLTRDRMKLRVQLRRTKPQRATVGR